MGMHDRPRPYSDCILVLQVFIPVDEHRQM